MTLFRVLACAALVLGACGPAGGRLGGGDAGAAQAVAQASSALQREPSGVNVDIFNIGLSVTVNGRKGGKATITYKVLASSTGGGEEITVRYDKYTDDGRTYYDGTLTCLAQASVGASLAAAEISVTGKLTMTGEIEDFLDIEVKEAVTVGETSVGIVLKGKVLTDSGTHEYDGQNMDFGLDLSLPVEPRH